jgi:hypothetical protein
VISPLLDASLGAGYATPALTYSTVEIGLNRHPRTTFFLKDWTNWCSERNHSGKRSASDQIRLPPLQTFVAGRSEGLSKPVVIRLSVARERRSRSERECLLLVTLSAFVFLANRGRRHMVDKNLFNAKLASIKQKNIIDACNSKPAKLGLSLPLEPS